MAESIEQWLADELADGLAGVLESMTEQRPVAVHEPAGVPAAAGRLWWEQPLSISPEATVIIGAPREAWFELGSRALRSAGIDPVEEAEARDTYVEILGQTLSGVAQSIGARIGREVACGRGAEIQEAPAGAGWISLAVSYPDRELPHVLAGWSAGLMEALQTPRTAPVSNPFVPLREEPEDSAETPASQTLDLLLEVEMPVSISFGRAELPLKDVLKLTSGSIVELNRSISEPVEVIVKNCVIARGEVVVMDGNYGVKINRIVSPRERLRTLK